MVQHYFVDGEGGYLASGVIRQFSSLVKGKNQVHYSYDYESLGRCFISKSDFKTLEI